MKWVSQYSIFVPWPDEQNNILVHGYTGALDIVEANLARRMMNWSGSSVPVPASELDASTLEYLEQRGYITALSIAEEVTFARDIALGLREDLNKFSPHFYIMPTYDCQIHCTYCFESRVRSRAYREGWLGEVMQPDVINAAFQAIDQINTSKEKRSIELYGGEPLMRHNRECVQRILESGRERGFVFFAATNGLDLDAYLDLLGPDKIACVQIPVDGIGETHNTLRRYSDGRPTFDCIMRNVQLALEQGVYVRLRVNVMRNVLENLDKFLTFLTERGFTQSKMFSCYFKSAFPSSRLTIEQHKELGYVSEAEIVRQLSRYPEFGKMMTGYPVIDSRVKSLFQSQIWNALSPSHCAAASSIYVFDPLGHIYPCNNVVGDPQHCIGYFVPGLQWNKKILDQWHRRSVENMQTCIRCKYAFFCGGGCLYRALVDYGDLNAPHCDDFAHSFEAFIISTYKSFCANAN